MAWGSAWARSRESESSCWADDHSAMFGASRSRFSFVSQGHPTLLVVRLPRAQFLGACFSPRAIELHIRGGYAATGDRGTAITVEVRDLAVRRGDAARIENGAGPPT